MSRLLQSTMVLVIELGRARTHDPRTLHVHDVDTDRPRQLSVCPDFAFAVVSVSSPLDALNSVAR